MDKIYFKVSGQSLMKTGGLSTYASDTVEYIQAEFTLSDEWKEYDSVRAVWQNGDIVAPPSVLDSEGKCIVPFEVLAERGRVTVNLVGSSANGIILTKRITSYIVTAFMVTVKVNIDGSDPQTITPSQFEQFVEAVKDNADRAEAGAGEAKDEADRAESEADQATLSAQASEASAIRASGHALDAESSAASARAYAQSAQNSATSAENAKDDAIDAKDKILSMRATAETLEAGSDATASYSDGLLTLGIPRGDKGAKGDTGVTPNLSIGTVETLEPTQDAYVTRRGTGDNPIFDFGIPKGDTGARGPQGPPGVTGNGIASAVLNSDYTLTLTFTDGTSYTTPSIRGAQGEISAADLQSAIAPLQYTDYKNDVAIKSAYAGSLAIISGNVQTAGKQGRMAFLNLAYRAYSDITFGTSEVLELPADMTPSANTILFATTNSGSELVNCYIRSVSRAIVVGGSIRNGLELRILGFYAV